MPIMSVAMPGGSPSMCSSAPWRSRIALGTSSTSATSDSHSSSSLRGGRVVCVCVGHAEWHSAV